MLFILPIALILLFLTTAAFAQDKPETAASDTESKPDAATQEIIQKSLASLGSRQTVQADLVEQVLVSDPPIRMTGRYLEQGKKTRLELDVRLQGDSRGSLLEVSDGEILWSQTTFGESKQVALRDLKQIAAALAEQPELTPAGSTPDLGLGGLTGLLTSLQRTMQFNQQREEKNGDSKLIAIQGTWKAEYAAQWKKNPTDELPAYIPDSLRISFDPDTLFPRRLLYLKRHPEKKTYFPLVRLDFQNVRLDQPVEESAFQFTPPESLVPDDITDQYIEQLKRRNTPPDAEPKANAGGKSK